MLPVFWPLPCCQAAWWLSAVQDCRARISSSGSCQVNVARTLDAHLSGSGSVLVSGHPQISSRSSGSGRVRPQ